MMTQLHLLMSSLIDLLATPLQHHPAANLVLWSAFAGVALALVFPKLSNQRRLQVINRIAKADLMAIRLFKDDPLVACRSLARLCGATLLKLMHWLPAAAVFSLPAVLLLPQCAARYEHRPLTPGETVLVSVQLSPVGWAARDDVELTTSVGLVAETPVLRDADDRRLYWRLRVVGNEPAMVTWSSQSEDVTQRIAVAGGRNRVTPADPITPADDGIQVWLHPSQPPLPRLSSFTRIDVQYPQRTTSVLGVTLPWWLTLLVTSTVAALLVRWLTGTQF